jgi:hypothetical protein
MQVRNSYLHAGTSVFTRLAATILIALTVMTPSRASAQEQQGREVKELSGDWTVDLRPTRDSPAYLKPMRIEVASDNAVTGTFYESAIESGRADASKGRACFAFTTSDGSGPYQTSGCVVGDKIEGQTWSSGRGFLLVWTASRPAQ